MHYFILVLILISSNGWAKLYRWVDENGKVHYSDKLPPQVVKKPHVLLDENGLPIKEVKRAKTPEEIEEEKRLEELRRKMRRKLEEQKARDRVLLSTFQSEDDIILSRDGKLAALDVQIRITYKNIEQLKSILAEEKRKAADFERRGKKIPASLQENINRLRQQIKESYAVILRHSENKKRIREKYAADLARFRELKKLAAAKSIDKDKKEKTNALVKTAIACTPDVDCEATWRRAKAFARHYATTPVYVDSDQIFITQPPKTKEDISVTVSRIEVEKGKPEVIFLDVQCKPKTGMSQNKPWCEHPTAEKMRQTFRAVVLRKKTS